MACELHDVIHGHRKWEVAYVGGRLFSEIAILPIKANHTHGKQDSDASQEPAVQEKGHVSARFTERNIALVMPTNAHLACCS